MQGPRAQERVPRLSKDFTSQAPVDIKSMMPTERKSLWRTAEERRMSDLTRVLEWMERRWGKKKRALQRQRANEELFRFDKEDKKSKANRKTQEETQKVSFRGPDTQKLNKRRDPKYSKVFGMEQPARQLSINLNKDGQRKSDLDIKDAIALESTQRPYRRQSTSLDPVIQDGIFSGRRIMRDWTTKTPDTTYERRLKNLMDKGTEPKIENVKMLKPEEVLSCRYLRLSKNNIRTLLKLCKDAGLDVDIHPHMVEAEIDAKKVFDRMPSVSL
ncbi:uncharacterized protein C16orf78 homolog [Perognathus longimembris pacificus]|uniref:uncharacterized protein C16orf78 homolog n=1 Tax=Perognathus longimembris pacificus TaxID=214514 RepID=UPI002018CAE5|nr:uncharacterized protein C16orf78 homolog [Perognathus longimembris pacificus]